VSDKVPALFLDRDGVINEDRGYVHKPEDTVFLPGIFELVRVANQRGYKVIVVTNQAGIGRGYYTEAAFQNYTEWQLGVFAQQAAHIAAVYHCPHHPEFGLGSYGVKCQCRKPEPGMLLQAAIDHGIDLPNSILIGDKEGDVQAGKKSGVATSIIVTGSVLGCLRFF
jgi:D-glycero-D-manno-heptose 1,7-bisphosphate phosphatase